MWSWLTQSVSDFGAATWLGYSAVSGLCLLALGVVVVRCCRQPILRIRLIQWTFIACLLVPVVQQLRLLPGYEMSTGFTGIEEPGSSKNLDVASSSGTPDTDAREIDDVSPSIQYTARLDERAWISRNSESLETGDDAAVEPIQSTRPHEDHTDSDSHWSLGVSVKDVIQLSYMGVVTALAVWWLFGWTMRRRLERDCRPAGANTVRVLESITDGKARNVRLLVSECIVSPFMWGLFRPTIVIPAAFENCPNDSRLRWGLAHEWSHIQRYDFLTHQLANVTKFVCFYQPLYWWLKRELALSQDFLADAFATQNDDSEDYAAFLVTMARSRNAAPATVGLGVVDGRSSLFKRVRELLQPARPMRQTASKLQSSLIAAVAVIVMSGVSSVHLGDEAISVSAEEKAAVAAEEDKSDESPGKTNSAQGGENNALDEEKPYKLPPAPGVDPITYTGKVVNRETGEPIAGATVQIKRELSRDPKTGKWILLEMTEHQSDENGSYQFTVPPEQAAQSSLYLEVAAHHPDYQPKSWSGYSHSMIRTNLEKGDPPFYATIKLSPGEAITGTVTRPDGTPIAGVQIGGYTKGVPGEGDNQNSSWYLGAWQNTETDENGRFRMVVATPGDGVFWIYPSEFAAEAHRIGDRRGDLGTFKLQEGVVMTGKVLDAKGSPVPNVGVEMRRRGDGAEADEFLQANAVANGIRAGTMTDEDGAFTLKPLPPGTYTAEIEEVAHDPTEPRVNWFNRRRDKMPHVFTRQQIEIAGDVKPDPITIQAMPHVIIRGRFFDGDGNPRASHVQHFFGRFNESFFFTDSTRPGDDGWFEFRVPHGVTEARINTSTNEHSSLRWKLAGMEKLTYGREIPLGTIEADVEGLEIVRYAAPILLVKAVDEQGNNVDGFTVTSEYTKPPAEIDGNARTGVVYQTGDVNFDRQADGRMRSSQLLPDAEITVTPTKDGFQTEPQAVTLKENETRELKFVMKQKPAAETDAVQE
jgi:beta-lactamase regulating signal transducer with metallopeptidase domain/protocatechuate 3,4-dioxygenase beta subunit